MVARTVLSMTLPMYAAAIEPLRVDGLVTAVVSPFENGTVALDRIPSISKYLKDTGVDYVFVGGTTGESLSMTSAERMALVETWSKMPQELIAHVGAESIEDAKALTKHAAKHGAKAIGYMPSVFFKPATVDILAKMLQTVGAAAPELPLYYYHIPSMTGVEFLMLDLIEAIEKIGVPTFAGVKYTGLYETRAFPDMQKCMAYSNGKYEVFCGREEMMTEALSIGTKGFIGSQPNVVGDLYNAIKNAWPHGDYLKLQMHALSFLDVQLGAPAGVNVLKLAMEFAGLDVGNARLPNVDADEATKKNIYASLEHWCKEGRSKFNMTFKMCERRFKQNEIVV